MTTKLDNTLEAISSSGCPLSPPKVPVSGYVPAFSLGLMLHEAVPVASVGTVVVHVSVPLRLKVSCSPTIGAVVNVSVKVPESVVASP